MTTTKPRTTPDSRGEPETEKIDTSTECTIEDVEALPVAPHLGIGVFDSGSGGMVTAGFVARMLEEADLPASTVFFGDTKHLPYGTRTEQQVAVFSDRYACFGFSGTPPPLAMFRSLGLKRILRVASLADASS